MVYTYIIYSIAEMCPPWSVLVGTDHHSEMFNQHCIGPTTKDVRYLHVYLIEGVARLNSGLCNKIVLCVNQNHCMQCVLIRITTYYTREVLRNTHVHAFFFNSHESSKFNHHSKIPGHISAIGKCSPLQLYSSHKRYM